MKWLAVIAFGAMGFYLIVFKEWPWWGALFIVLAIAASEGTD